MTARRPTKLFLYQDKGDFYITTTFILRFKFTISCYDTERYLLLYLHKAVPVPDLYGTGTVAKSQEKFFFLIQIFNYGSILLTDNLQARRFLHLFRRKSNVHKFESTDSE
jgi:hypothetical protein